MSLQEIPSESFRERSIPVLETERLVLRAPRLGDAKTVAVLANDRRIAENTARIPHPYRLADAEDFIASANLGNEAVFLITSVVLGVMLSNVLKMVFNRHRPDVEASMHVFTASFPSGHATLSAVVYLTLGVLLAKSAPSGSLRSYFIGLAILLAFLVGVSRIYLGMHYPTDVIAGWCVGISWAMLCWAAVDLIEHYEGRHSPRR